MKKLDKKNKATVRLFREAVVSYEDHGTFSMESTLRAIRDLQSIHSSFLFLDRDKQKSMLDLYRGEEYGVSNEAAMVYVARKNYPLGESVVYELFSALRVGGASDVCQSIEELITLATKKDPAEKLVAEATVADSDDETEQEEGDGSLFDSRDVEQEG